MDTIHQGDCREEMKKFPDNSVHSIITDPPYELGFMGKKWDKKGIAYDPLVWSECLRVLRPGGHMLVFGGTRTYHRMACAIEDAGFECRDMLEWTYGSGFPKSLDISKALDKMVGAERKIIGKKISPYTPTGRNELPDYGKFNQPTNDNGYLEYPITAPATDAAKQWSGFGTALKPAHEPIGLFRKPLDGCTIAENVIKWGCGGLNIDGCRIGGTVETWPKSRSYQRHDPGEANKGTQLTGTAPSGRFPANLILDGSECVKALFPDTKTGSHKPYKQNYPGWKNSSEINTFENIGDSGSASRFFQSCPFTDDDIPALIYCAKASRAERERGLEGMPGKDTYQLNGMKTSVDGRPGRTQGERTNEPAKNFHPTVKPLSLMRYLCRLITPPNGLVLDPFVGSGTTCLAAKQEGFHYIGIELEPDYCEIARRRIASIPIRLDDFVK